jgi:putative transposase
MTRPHTAGVKRFVTDGVLAKIGASLAAECQELGDLEGTWQAARHDDGQGPDGRRKKGPNPSDRAKPGTKKSLHGQAAGGPLGIEIAGANVHDARLGAPTLAVTVIERPDPSAMPRHLCLEEGYDNPSGQSACEAAGYITHIRRIGEEKLDDHGQKRHPARRWVVERTLAWLSKCRAILIRYDKKPQNYKGLIQLACALLWYRRLYRPTRGRAVLR